MTRLPHRVLAVCTAVVLLAMAVADAVGQSALLQAGPVAPGHAPMYVNSGTSQPVVQDSGKASGGQAGVGMSEGLYVARGTGTPPYAGQGSGPYGANWCDYDAPVTNASGYHYLCLSPNAQGGGLLAYGAGGVATPEALSFLINGTQYQFPAIVGGVAGPTTSTIGHFATWNNGVGTLLSDFDLFGTANSWPGTQAFSSATVPTRSAGDSTTNAASTAFVQNAISGGGGGPQSANTVFAGPTTGADAPPTFRSLVTNDLPANGVTNAKLATMTTHTIKGNPTGSTATPSDVPLADVLSMNGTSLTTSFTQVGAGAVAYAVGPKLQQTLSVKDFGAKGDAVVLSTGAITSTTNVFTASGANFSSADVGKIIRINGAGVAGAILETTISSVTNATTVVTAANAGTTVTGAVSAYCTDDTAAIQATITQAAQNTPSADIRLPSGAYCTTSALAIASGMALTGDGMPNSVILPATAITAIAIDTPQSVTIEKLGITYLQVGATSTAGISVTSTAGAFGNVDSVFRDVTIVSPYTGISVNSAARFIADDVKVYGFVSTGITATNLKSPDSGDSSITNCSFINSSNLGTGILYGSGGGLRITNSKIASVQFGIRLVETAGATTSQLIIANNSIDTTSADAIRLERSGTTATFSRVVITDNIITLATVGVNIPLDATGIWLTSVVITGNTFDDAGTAGDVTFAINSAQNFNFSNNTMRTFGTSTATAISAGSSAQFGVIGPNIKIGTWLANSIASTNTTTIAPN